MGDRRKMKRLQKLEKKLSLLKNKIGVLALVLYAQHFIYGGQSLHLVIKFKILERREARLKKRIAKLRGKVS
jgi:hypothetical protein